MLRLFTTCYQVVSFRFSVGSPCEDPGSIAADSVPLSALEGVGRSDGYVSIRGERMRGGPKLIFVGVVLIAAAVTIAALIVRSTLNQYGDLSQPSDAILESNFKQHESDLELLLEMSNADNRVVRISSDFTWLANNAAWPRPESELGFSQESWDQYRTLFRKVGLESGITREKSGEVVYFIFSSKGLVPHGTEKGYTFSKKELSPTVDSLDDFTRFPKGQRVMFKKLKEHWYMFYMSG